MCYEWPSFRIRNWNTSKIPADEQLTRYDVVARFSLHKCHHQLSHAQNIIIICMSIPTQSLHTWFRHSAKRFLVGTVWKEEIDKNRMNKLKSKPLESFELISFANVVFPKRTNNFDKNAHWERISACVRWN